MGAPRILLVDHDRELAELARGSLEEIGYRVEVAHDGEDALVLCRTMRPDLVVADVVLPRRSGMELAALAKAEDPRLPVILTSGAALDPSEIAARLRQCGADDMLLKPFAMTELRERIATLRAATGDDAPAPVVLGRPSSLADATEGDIAPGVLVPLLLGLRARRHTGVLRLRTGARWKDIVLLDGRPIWADGGDDADRLGTMLLDEGTITREQFEAAVRAMGERGLDFGSALTEGRALTASALYVQLRRLVLRRAVAGFGWTVGTWRRIDTLPRQTASFEVAPLQVVLRGVLAHGDPVATAAALAPHEDRWAVPTAAFEAAFGELRGDELASAVSPFLDGSRTVGQLRALDLVSDDGFDALLWVLFLGGAVGFADAPPSDLGPDLSTTLPQPFVADPSLADLVERIVKDYLRYWQANCFALFGIAADADDAAVAAVIDRPILAWAGAELPDRLPQDLRAKASALRIWVEDARQTLRDPGTRRAYRMRVSEGLTGLYRRVERPGVAEGAMLFQVGKGFIQKQNFVGAEASFARAAELVPGNAEYPAWTGYCRWRRIGGREGAAAGRERLEAALALDPHCPSAHFFLGVIARECKEYAAAVEAFATCLRYDPSHEGARRAHGQAERLVAGTRRSTPAAPTVVPPRRRGGS